MWHRYLFWLYILCTLHRRVPGETILDRVLINESKLHTPQSGVLHVHESYAVPGTQGWSRCLNCVLDAGGRITVSENRLSLHGNETIVLSWSLWSEFFHRFKNDRYHATASSTAHAQAQYRIHQPIFILPIITLHIGHVLIDVLEQLYQAHKKHYGRVLLDCIIVLDVASEFERPVLGRKIDLQVNHGDEVGSLISLFTSFPVQSMSFLDELRSVGTVVLSDLHIGADISGTFFNAGQKAQPCMVSLEHGNAETIALAKRYRAFSNVIRTSHNQQGGAIQKPSVERRRATPAASVLIVQRRKNRVIVNADELGVLSSDAGHVTEIADLEDLPFSQQRTVFAQTDVLVSMAGTALHNVLFMRPGSAVVMFMQPNWCEQAWMYANQAVLLGIKPFIYCAPSAVPVEYANAADSAASQHIDALKRTEAAGRKMPRGDPGPIRHYGWTRQTWLQGPREHKSDNITVNTAAFARLLEDAVRHTEKLRSGAGVAGLATADLQQDDRSLGPMMCPGDGPSQTPHRASHSGTRQPDRYTKIRKGVQSGAARDRLLGVYVSSITVEATEQEQGWKVGIVGELGGAQGGLERLLQSMPRLAVCMESVDMPPWCYPLGAFNYYTDLFLHMDRPVQGLHVWAQTSSTGGKVRNSDVYVALDCRLPEAGFALHKQVIGRVVHLEVVVREHCVPNATTAGSPETGVQPQMVHFPSNKFDAERWTCRSSQRVMFAYKMTSRLSLQRHSADFCLLNALTPRSCIEFVGELQRYLYQQLRAEQLGLPSVQYAPTIQNPFFLIHIEKTAGTTLRE
jgi:hypothetical protein